ncbi:hypothetical protein C356_03615 [Cryptococcus neoformans c45]|nr:hypothetical protein C356_03615 [Cryptococcus neoformans var. grubii c45]
MSVQSSTPLPNRAVGSLRSRQQPIAEYQPLDFDREASQAAYQETLRRDNAARIANLGANATRSTSTAVSNGASLPSNQGAISEKQAGISSASSDYKPNEKTTNFTGAGRNYQTQPQEITVPLEKSGPSILSPVAGSSAPPLPPREAIPQVDNSGPAPGALGRPPSYPGENLQTVDEEDRGKGKRKALPPIPADVPPQEPAPWQPDYKPQIPESLIASSVQHAYTSLSAPPPNIQQRNKPPVNMPQAVGYMTASAGVPSSSKPPPRPANIRTGSQTAGPLTAEPITLSPTGSVPSPSSSPPPRPRPEAETQVTIKAPDKTPIWSTHYLDPCLRSTIIHVPHQISNIANVALSGLASGPKEMFNTTIGAPIDGLAREVKGWTIGADGKFSTEEGGIELGIGVIRSGRVEGEGGKEGKDKGKDKGRKTARVEVNSKKGGVKVDVIEIDRHRQIDLRVETKSGDVLVLLPENFLGPIHITSPQCPTYLPIISPLIKPTVNPYANLYTTYMVPLALARDPKHSSSQEYTTAKNIEKYVPKPFREESDILDQVSGGYTSHVRKSWSKLNIKTEKGRVVVGMRESKDEEVVKELGLRVGRIDGIKKDKKWWKL